MNTDFMFFKMKHEGRNESHFIFYKIGMNEGISVSPVRGIRKIEVLPQIYLNKVFVIDESEFEENKKRILNQLGL